MSLLAPGARLVDASGGLVPESGVAVALEVLGDEPAVLKGICLELVS